MKVWIKKAKEYLAKSLDKVPQELNELDWKETLSPRNLLFMFLTGLNLI